jgi:signal peptidase I
MIMNFIVLLSWLAIPVGLLAVIDDWFLRPHRQLASGAQGGAKDPVLVSIAYGVLPVLIIAAVLRLLLAERLDFSAVLLLITVVTGLIWWIDVLFLRRRRASAALQAGKEPSSVSEPGTVDYARSFFPVALVVLLLRSFIFEPFRIPSDSMMPTLLDGDFIIVNKYAYGLRWPVLNTRFFKVGEPERGDVVVFRFPLDPSTNYIKRLVGLPGDTVQVRDDRLYVNGTEVPFNVTGVYDDGCYVNFMQASETLGEHTHRTMFCPTALDQDSTPRTACNRKKFHAYVCGERAARSLFGEEPPYEKTVPPGTYLMIGDNRDNSADGRVWGFVPEANLVGKATRIWFNWDLQRSGGPLWERIGSRIE